MTMKIINLIYMEGVLLDVRLVVTQSITYNFMINQIHDLSLKNIHRCKAKVLKPNINVISIFQHFNCPVTCHLEDKQSTFNKLCIRPMLKGFSYIFMTFGLDYMYFI